MKKLIEGCLNIAVNAIIGTILVMNLLTYYLAYIKKYEGNSSVAVLSPHGQSGDAIQIAVFALILAAANIIMYKLGNSKPKEYIPRMIFVLAFCVFGTLGYFRSIL